MRVAALPRVSDRRGDNVPQPDPIRGGKGSARSLSKVRRISHMVGHRRLREGP